MTTALRRHRQRAEPQRAESLRLSFWNADANLLILLGSETRPKRLLAISMCCVGKISKKERRMAFYENNDYTHRL